MNGGGFLFPAHFSFKIFLKNWVTTPAIKMEKSYDSFLLYFFTILKNTTRKFAHYIKNITIFDVTMQQVQFFLTIFQDFLTES